MGKIRNYQIFSAIFVIILGTLFHFIYQLSGENKIVAIFSSVNESVWEHMKLIVSSTLIFSIFEYYIYKKKDIAFNNFILSCAISSILGIIIYLLLYIPINDIFGHKAYIAIGLLFLIFILIQIISYYIMNYKQIKYSNDIGILLVIIVYSMFGYLTYHPPKINLFYDFINNTYGMIKSS